MTPQTFAHRNLHLQKLSEKIRNEQQHPAPQPVIVVGDFNLTPWSPIFADFERSSGLHNAADGFGFTPTWYRFDGFPFGLVLDHVLVSGDMQCAAYDVGPDIRSDHRSVTVQLRFPDSTAQPE
jgi:endonuclease/exonuclease/phosphatase (EEP) superfamily protein YafD